MLEGWKLCCIYSQCELAERADICNNAAEVSVHRPMYKVKEQRAQKKRMEWKHSWRIVMHIYIALVTLERHPSWPQWLTSRLRQTRPPRRQQWHQRERKYRRAQRGYSLLIAVSILSPSTLLPPSLTIMLSHKDGGVLNKRHLELERCFQPCASIALKLSNFSSSSLLPQLFLPPLSIGSAHSREQS